ncbi:MAG TPA: hypothetical protein VLB47_13955 [Solirubrobacteraceae bacterium]|nr:hypothetical protein [Solirubrobacteraceae bacterium]
MPSPPSLPALLHAAFSYDPSPDFGANPWPFVIMMLAGFVVGIAGHVVRARALVVVGIGLIFLATFLLPLAANILRSTG